MKKKPKQSLSVTVDIKSLNVHEVDLTSELRDAFEEAVSKIIQELQPPILCALVKAKLPEFTDKERADLLKLLSEKS